LYEYACKSCDAKFEQLVRTSERDSTKIKCPECGSTKTARALSLVSVGADQKGAKSADTPICGRCGETRGSCSM
jgi:putative FmdB family regulatory protein